MDLWDMNLRHLAAVAKIAELGTMNAAASAVNLTQPALTQALARIEAALGLPLFERRHDGMVPTDAADLLVPRLRAASDHIASSQVTMSRMRALLALADSGMAPITMRRVSCPFSASTSAKPACSSSRASRNARTSAVPASVNTTALPRRSTSRRRSDSERSATARCNEGSDNPVAIAAPL